MVQVKERPAVPSHPVEGAAGRWRDGWLAGWMTGCLFMNVVRCEKVVRSDTMNEGGPVIGSAGAIIGRGAATAATVVNFCEGTILKEKNSVGPQRDLRRWVGYRNR